jgi:hypothetical protein
VDSSVVTDGLFERRHRSEGATASSLACDLGEPALDKKVERRRVDWSEVDVIARALLEPNLEPRACMSALVVYHDVDLGSLGHRAVKLIEEGGAAGDIAPSCACVAECHSQALQLGWRTALPG